MKAAPLAASVPSPPATSDLRNDPRPRDTRERIVPIGTSSVLALLLRSAFETNQEKHQAPLLVNLREGAIEIAQRQPLSDRLPMSAVATHCRPRQECLRARCAGRRPRRMCRKLLGGEAGFRGFYLLKSAISRNITGLSLSTYTQGKLSYYIYRI